MAVKVRIPRQLRDRLGGNGVPEEAEAEGATLRDALESLDARWPGLRDCVVDEHGDIREHVKVFVAGSAAADTTAALHEGDTIHIVAAVSGG